MHAIAASSSAAQYGGWAYPRRLRAHGGVVRRDTGDRGGRCGLGRCCGQSGKTQHLCGADRGNAGAPLRAAWLDTTWGDRWGRKLLDSPGRGHERRQKAVATAEAVYAKWGRLAVFFTSTIISGVLRMKYSQFVVWNFVVGAVYVLSVGPAAYGAGQDFLASELDGGSLGALVAGLAITAGCAVLAARYYHRRKARRLPAGCRH